MYTDNNYDWESQNRQTVLDGRRILERTGESIARSNQIAIETENVGIEVVSELGDQREALLRAKNRLTSADNQLAKTRDILRKMSKSVLYNKLILILIIILEVLILASVAYLKFFKK